MRKYETIGKIVELGIIAIIRTDSPQKAVKIADACLQGGIKVLEVTFSVPGADRVISSLRERYAEEELLLGAGTVLDSETARIAHLAGAAYIVAPSFNVGTAKLCNRYQIPYMPGCFTIREMVEAMEAGVEIIKLFPGSAFTPDIIKAVRGPLPQALLMPTGGVNLDNVEAWFKAGSAAVGVGGSLTTADGDDYSSITRKCKEFIQKIKNVRSYTIEAN